MASPLDGAFAAGQLATECGTLKTILRKAGDAARFCWFSTDRSVQRLFGGLNGGANFPVVVTTFHVQFGQEADGISIEPVSFKVLMVS